MTAAYLIAISFLSALAVIDMVAQSGNPDWVVPRIDAWYALARRGY